MDSSNPYQNTNGIFHKTRTNNSKICMETRKIPNNQSNLEDFPGGAVVKNPPANARDTGSSPGLGRFHMPWSN